MRISILSPDLSHNCLGRAYLLAKIIQQKFDVEIVGPSFREEIWEPVCNDKSITYKTIKLQGRIKPYYQLISLAKQVSGDLIYISKPWFSSLGVGLIAMLLKKRPLVLDIDDWEMGFVWDAWNKMRLIEKIKYLIRSTLFSYRIGTFWNAILCEWIAKKTSFITVSNEFLQKKFGGIIIYHARNTDLFDPNVYCSFKLRKKYFLDDQGEIVIFLGTVRPYKGVEELIYAIKKLRKRNIYLMVVGLNENNQFEKKIALLGAKELGKHFVKYGSQPFEKIPEFLACANIVVIPQTHDIATVGQIPAKLFDAMAMGKPIVAVETNDIKKILEGCGVTIPKSKSDDLAQAINYLLDNREDAIKLGYKAREKCIANYSFQVVETKLMKIFSESGGFQG